MTIIKDEGDDFWIESHLYSIVLTDAAGLVTGSDTNLDSPGTLLGITITPINTPNNDNTQSVGTWDALFNAGADAFAIGLHIADFRLRVTKLIGTAGNTTLFFAVLLLMRRTH